MASMGVAVPALSLILDMFRYVRDYGLVDIKPRSIRDTPGVSLCLLQSALNFVGT